MSVQSEFLPTLLNCIASFKSFQFEANQVGSRTTKYNTQAMICQISVIELGTKLEMELKVSRQNLDLKLLSPLKGIESCASHIPVFANFMTNGYLNKNHDNFSERGANSLLSALEDVVNVFKLATLFPNTILAYYSFAFEKAKQLNLEAKFAQLSPQSEDGRAAYLFIEHAVKKNYGFTTYYPQNILVCFQNIITNHSNIFKPELN